MPRGKIGKLIAEIYETKENSRDVPRFEYIFCDLSNCFKRNDTATLKDIIESGFDSVSRKDKDEEARGDVLGKLKEAHLDMIDVQYSRGKRGNEPCIKLSNVIQDSIINNGRTKKRKMDSIILFGRYKFSSENTSTVLKDAQRLSLVYSTYEEASIYDNLNNYDDDEEKKEISLNITFFEE